MSYRVLTGPAIPFVHALPGGLGETPGETPGTWKDIIFQLSQPFAQAASQRIAYGKTDPYYGSGFLSPMQSQYGPGYSSMGFGGISPTMLLVGGAALVAMMMLRK